MIFAIRTIFHAFVSTKPPNKARAFLSPFYVVNMFKKKIKNPDHNAYIIKYLHFPMALCMQRHMSLMYDNTRNQFLPDVVLLYSNFSIPMYHSIVWKRPPNMVTKLQYVFFFLVPNQIRDLYTSLIKLKVNENQDKQLII